MRKFCKKCQQRPCAINYYKNERPYYRSVCDHCAKKRGDGIPLWERVGYKKKNVCDRCSFTSKHKEQFNVYHVDGDLQNCKFSNLKTVCANCQRILDKTEIRWRRGDLQPDF